MYNQIMETITGTKEYEPKDYGEIIDLTIKFFLKRFSDYAYITYAVFLPLTLIMGIVFTAGPEIVDQKDPVKLALFFLISGMFSAAITVIFVGAAIKYTSETFLGNKISYKDSFRYSLKIYPHLTLTLMLVSAIIGIPGVLTFSMLIYGQSIIGPIPDIIVSMLLLLAGAYGFYCFTMVPYVLIIENKTGIQALKRSIELFRSSKNASSKVVMMPMFINSLTSILTMFASFVPFVGILLVFLCLPITIITMTLVYYDIRMRYEGLDLLLIAENMEKQESNENSHNIPIYDFPGEGISAES